MSRPRHALAVAVVLLAGHVCALEASAVRSALDRGANWLIEQFDLKEGVFGKGEQAKDVVTVAMCLKALCGSPHDYRETSGPFISESVKYIRSQVSADGTLKGENARNLEAYAWVLAALKAASNDSAHGVVIGKMLKAGRVATGADENDMAMLKWQTAVARARMGITSNAPPPPMIPDDAGREKAEARAAEILKVQQPDGSFSKDPKAHSAFLIELNRCYQSLE